MRAGKRDYFAQSADLAAALRTVLDNAGPGAMPGPAGSRLALHKSGHYAHAKQPALPLRQPGFLVFGREHRGLQA